MACSSAATAPMIVITTRSASRSYTDLRASIRNKGLFLPHQIATQQQSYRLVRRIRQRECLLDPVRHVTRRLEIRERNTQRLQHVLRDAAALRLPRIALAELTSMADQHEQRNS